MTLIKTLWASVQNSPTLMRRVNGWLCIFWIVMIPVSYEMGWLDSVIYVSALSLWALVSGHWSAWQAARVEVRQEQEMQAALEHDLPGEIVERLVEETSIESGDARRPGTGGASAPSVEEQLAQIVGLCLDLADRQGIDLGSALDRRGLVAERAGRPGLAPAAEGSDLR